MNEYQIKQQLVKHWNWLKQSTPEEVAEFVIRAGKRTNDLPPLSQTGTTKLYLSKYDVTGQ